MKQYLELLQEVLAEGNQKGDRTGTGTLSVFGRMVRFDLSKGFPILTTKKIIMDSVIKELLWFISGDTNAETLKKQGVNIWNAWAKEDGSLGPIYGYQWRHWGKGYLNVSKPLESPDLPLKSPVLEGVDQLAWVINEIKTNPDSRRLLVSSWNPLEIDDMGLPPCHCLFQFYVNDGKLSCMLTQRSADIFLGVPYNISSYALLTMMIAQVCGLHPGEFVHSFGDLHLYNNHIEPAKTQLARKLKRLPTMKLNKKVKNIDDFKVKDFVLDGYDPHAFIKAPISV